MTEELRLYSFTNFYLSSIQQGIQTGHAAVDLFVKYHPHHCPDQDGEAMDMLYDWAKNWKTFICLNGGDSAGVGEMFNFLSDQRHPFPFAPFYESEQALEGVMTTVAVVLPARIFETAQFLRMRELPSGVSYSFDRLLDEHRYVINDDDGLRGYTFTPWEHELMVRLNRYSLAR